MTKFYSKTFLNIVNNLKLMIAFVLRLISNKAWCHLSRYINSHELLEPKLHLQQIRVFASVSHQRVIGLTIFNFFGQCSKI